MSAMFGLIEQRRSFGTRRPKMRKKKQIEKNRVNCLHLKGTGNGDIQRRFAKLLDRAEV